METNLEIRLLPNFPYTALAEEFPQLQFKILRLFPLGNGLVVEDVQILGDLSDNAVTNRILSQLRKGLVEVLENTSQRLTIRNTRGPCPLSTAFQNAWVVPQFPMQIAPKALSLRVQAPREKVRRFLSELKLGGLEFSILGVWSRGKTTRAGKTGFTPRQSEVYRLARSAGYWDTPRRTTMTDMAWALHLSKSTLSETLATIERKVLKEGFDPNSC